MLLSLVLFVAALHRLNGKHVVFGTVVDGLRVLRAIEDVGSEDGAPAATVMITDCGEL